MLFFYHSLTQMKIVGVMSGSSLDGLDLVLCDFTLGLDGTVAHELMKMATIPFESSMMVRLMAATALSAKELHHLDTALGQYIGETILDFLDGSHVDYIASHGHTVYHAPDQGYTVQIGNGAAIAATADIDTVSDFRSTDLAYGGQGAPIAPIVERYLMAGKDFYLNIGGICNMSIHMPSGEILSWDIAPANQVLNLLSQRLGQPYDHGGALARTGSIHKDLLLAWKSIPYFQLRHPKSLDNSWVRDVFIPVLDGYSISAQDGLRTMVQFISDQIAIDFDRLELLPKREMTAIATGGGAHNIFLRNHLSDMLSQRSITLLPCSRELIDFKEAILMALMGFLRVKGINNVLASATGARQDSIGGSIHLAKAQR